MCGRFIQCTSGDRLAERFHLPAAPVLTPRYNVAPSQPVGAIRIAEDGRREWVALRWGLIPAWVPEPRTAYSTINARAETVADKPTYRHAFRRRRCLIPADGFYEWRQLGARKQPYCIVPTDGTAFAFAGLWERWEQDGQVLGVRHDPGHPGQRPGGSDPRPDAGDSGLGGGARWLDPAVTDPAALRPLLAPCPVEQLRLWPVGTAVNATRHDGPDLMAPVTLPAV